MYAKSPLALMGSAERKKGAGMFKKTKCEARQTETTRTWRNWKEDTT